MNEDNKTFGPTSFTFKGINWGKIGAGLGVAVAGAVLTYASQWITATDFGVYTPIVGVVFTFLSNIVRKWASDIE